MISVNKNNHMLIRFGILLFFIVIYIYGQNINALAASSQNSTYTYGFKIYQYNLKPGYSVADNPIPAAELGSFVAKKSEYTYQELIDAIGIPLTTGRLYRAIGYLNVKEPGTYTIITTSNQSKLYSCAFINKKFSESAQGNGSLVLTAPAFFSQSGLYEVDIRIYEYVNKDLVVPEGFSYAPKGKIRFLIKTPDTDLPQPAHKVLLLPLKQ